MCACSWRPAHTFHSVVGRKARGTRRKQRSHFSHMALRSHLTLLKDSNKVLQKSAGICVPTRVLESGTHDYHLLNVQTNINIYAQVSENMEDRYTAIGCIHLHQVTCKGPKCSSGLGRQLGAVHPKNDVETNAYLSRWYHYYAQIKGAVTDRWCCRYQKLKGIIAIWMSLHIPTIAASTFQILDAPHSAGMIWGIQNRLSFESLMWLGLQKYCMGPSKLPDANCNSQVT
jgi:hypothetical protein